MQLARTRHDFCRPWLIYEKKSDEANDDGAEECNVTVQLGRIRRVLLQELEPDVGRNNDKNKICDYRAGRDVAVSASIVLSEDIAASVKLREPRRTA